MQSVLQLVGVLWGCCDRGAVVLSVAMRAQRTAAVAAVGGSR